MDVNVCDYYKTQDAAAIECSVGHCHEEATGEAYSLGALVGFFCDYHGRREMDSGRADAAWPIDE